MSEEGQQEPSMEDILASIRKILSEDEEEGGEEGAAEAAPEDAAAPEPGPEPEPEPDPVFEPEPEPVIEPEEDDGPDIDALFAESDAEDEAAFAEPAPEAMELTDEMMVEEQEEFIPEPAPVVAEQPAPPPPPPPPQPAQEQPYQPYGQEGLVADQVEQVAGVHISQLAQAVAQERALTMGNQGITIEQLVREICTPILKQWLDHNLPYMVERIVRQEVERIVSRSERM